MAEKEGLYDIVQNKDGELLFCIRARAGSPAQPHFFYDGVETALLMRDARRAILLEYLSPMAVMALKKQDKVLIAEIMDDELEHEYYAPVSKVRKLPV
ncbi:MAG: hypothetical protein MJ247_07395 [Alphaproteobacteria bacterium]|nr:hypothetical protein [Alphaproteobacteria bacterium]